MALASFALLACPRRTARASFPAETRKTGGPSAAGSPAHGARGDPSLVFTTRDGGWSVKSSSRAAPSTSAWPSRGLKRGFPVVASKTTVFPMVA